MKVIAPCFSITPRYSNFGIRIKTLVFFLLFSSSSLANNNLLLNEVMYQGESLISDSGQFEFTLNANGRLVLINTMNERTLWTADTFERAAAQAQFQGDGNFLLRNENDTAIWASNTHNSQASELKLLDSGRVAIYSNNRIVWQISGENEDQNNGKSQLKINETLSQGSGLDSPNKRYQFTVQGDGNLMLYDSNDNIALWSSRTGGAGGIRAKLQSDGNFVLRDNKELPLWSTKTSRSGANLLRLTNDGKLILSGPEGTVWQAGNEGSDNPKLSHIGTTKRWDSNGLGLEIARPADSKINDLLVLFLHRTDDYLPLSLPGWKRVAECLKGDNGMDCATERQCRRWLDNQYCERFDDGTRGHDLAQAVFVREVTSNEANTYRFNLKSRKTNGGHPSWAILTVLRGANNTNPVRDWAHTGCDRDRDSRFPSVRGFKNDMVLLSQSFDDAEPARRFQAPRGTRLLAHIGQSDESGFLFAGHLDKSGETGILETRGDGASPCKDALISLVIRPR